MSQKVERGRTLARSQALQLLFQAEANDRSLEDVLAGDYLISKGPLNPYAVVLARGVAANAERIDTAIRSVSRNWSLERMPGADRNLLRLAVFEMSILEEDRPSAAVVIDEAVELAKAYGTDESARFVNGVLGRIARDTVLPSFLSSGSHVTAEDAEAACIAALWFEIDPARQRGRRSRPWDGDTVDAAGAGVAFDAGDDFDEAYEGSGGAAFAAVGADHPYGA